MRRAVLPLLILATPAVAWDFTPVPVCTLSHVTGTESLTVTFDPSQPEPYAIAVTRDAPWPDAPEFAIRFDGARGLTISTNRQSLSDEGRTLTVTDRGFGNVLDGLEFNTTATARSGEADVSFPLGGAAEKVRAFRACTEAPSA